MSPQDAPPNSNTSRDGTDPDIGDRVEPVPELTVEIIEIAERAAEEEVLADVAERPLHFALGLGPIGPAGFRLEPVVPGEIEETAVVNHETVDILTDDCSLHAVIEDLARRPADRLQRSDVAAEHGLQILVDEPRQIRRE